MNVYLNFSEGAFETLRARLLPPRNDLEHAAFIFANASTSGRGLEFDVVEVQHLTPADFAIQSAYHLELGDAARQRIIKRAHDLRSSLIEVHSHPGALSATFSRSDIAGLRETVPNIRWRLQKRPYAALVVTKTDFDALVWIAASGAPQVLCSICAGVESYKPTNNSLEHW